MGRPTNLVARRAQVADALVALLARGSFEEVSVAAMAKAAGLAPGLVHHYFASKDDVLRLAVDRLALRLQVRLTERLRGAGDDPSARVEAFIDAWLAVDPIGDPQAALAWVAIGDEARRRAEITDLYAAAITRIVAQLREEIARALPAPHRRKARFVATAVVVAIEGALRVGAAGGLAPGSAASLVNATATALINDARS
jgi:TetR/AcrR family transcriptional repressor of bet genes